MSKVKSRTKNEGMISDFQEYGKSNFTYEESLPVYKKIINGTYDNNKDSIVEVFRECDYETDTKGRMERMMKMIDGEIPKENYPYERNWETSDERLLNPIIDCFHEELKKNPFRDYFQKLEYYDDGWNEYPIDENGDEIEIPRPNSEDIEDLVKYSKTITKFLLNPNFRNQGFLEKHTWNLWEFINWMNWTLYRPIYELWGLEIFKWYDFVINHWDELSELGREYTKMDLVRSLIHDLKLKENRFGTPRVKSFMIDFTLRNQCIDDGTIDCKKLDVPDPSDVFKMENRPIIENRIGVQ